MIFFKILNNYHNIAFAYQCLFYTWLQLVALKKNSDLTHEVIFHHTLEDNFHHSHHSRNFSRRKHFVFTTQDAIGVVLICRRLLYCNVLFPLIQGDTNLENMSHRSDKTDGPYVQNLKCFPNKFCTVYNQQNILNLLKNL